MTVPVVPPRTPKRAHVAGASAIKGMMTQATVSPFGRRTAAMLTGAVVTIIMMLQAWFDLPIISKILGYLPVSGASGTEMFGVAKDAVSSGLSVPDLFGIANALRAFADYLGTMMANAGLSGGSFAQIQQVVGAASTVSIILTVVCVLWVVCFIGVVVGIVLRAFKGNDLVLFFALVATGMLALICVAAAFVLNGMIEGAVSDLLGSGMATSSVAAGFAAMKPVLGPGIGSVLALVAAVVSVLCSLVLRDER